jgi:hypothetical protein
MMLGKPAERVPDPGRQFVDVLKLALQAVELVLQYVLLVLQFIQPVLHSADSVVKCCSRLVMPPSRHLCQGGVDFLVRSKSRTSGDKADDLDKRGFWTVLAGDPHSFEDQTRSLPDTLQASTHARYPPSLNRDREAYYRPMGLPPDRADAIAGRPL